MASDKNEPKKSAGIFKKLSCFINRTFLSKTKVGDMLMFFPYNKLTKKIKEGDFDAVRNLIHKGIDLNKVDSFGNLPLVTAVDNENLGIVKYLVENGADVNAKAVTKLGYFETPLLVSLYKGNVEITKYLLENGADMHKNDLYDTPLIIAIETNNFNEVKCLVDHGADVNKKTDTGSFIRIPLLFAIERYHVIKNNIEIYSDFSSSDANMDIIDYLLEHNADVNGKNYRYTPLNTAINYGELDVVKCLLKHGADVNNADENGNIPLMVAISNNDMDIFKELLQYDVHFEKLPIDEVVRNKDVIDALFCTNNLSKYFKTVLSRDYKECLKSDKISQFFYKLDYYKTIVKENVDKEFEKKEICSILNECRNMYIIDRLVERKNLNKKEKVLETEKFSVGETIRL